MKLLKKIFYTIAVLFMLLCIGIVICAFQPDLTKKLSHLLYGTDGVAENLENAKDKLDGMKDFFGGEKDSTGVLVEVPGLGVHVGTQEGIDWERLPGNSYELTDTDTLVLPESVVGRSDTETITEEAKEIAEEEEALLADALATGDLGEGLEFDVTFYPYYGMLTDSMKSLYKQIYANALTLNGSFAPGVKVHTSQLKTVFEAVYNDHPELFWVETGYSCKYTNTGNVIEVTLKYNETASRLPEEKRRFDTAVEEIANQTRKYTDNLEKEQCVHDLLSERVEYKTSAPMNQSAFSALVNRQSVCAGYARAFQYLMQQLRIPTYYCTGYSDGSHAWNIVALGDRYANVDVTWDDTDPMTYDYYNKSDAEYRTTHLRTGLSVYLPACLDGTEESQKPLTMEEAEPEKPLEYFEPITEEVDNRTDEEKTEQKRLEEAGLTADQVISTLSAYNNACLIKTKNLGFGSHTFELYVPVSFYPEIERIYLDESYKSGYADEALKSIGAEHFAIQMQVARCNGGYYYKLYHNIAVWN